jgi:hypothetical protein
MFLEQAIQSPLVIKVGNERWSVPKLAMSDWAQLGQVIDAARMDVATRGMAPHVRLQLVSFYGFLPTTIEQLRAVAGSPAAVQFIPDHCLARARVIERDGVALPAPAAVPPERLQEVLATITPESRYALAMALTDAGDAQAAAARNGQDKASEAGPADPLASAPAPSPAASTL